MVVLELSELGTALNFFLFFPRDRGRRDLSLDSPGQAQREKSQEGFIPASQELPSAGFITASWSSVATLPAMPARQEQL